MIAKEIEPFGSNVSTPVQRNSTATWAFVHSQVRNKTLGSEIHCCVKYGLFEIAPYVELEANQYGRTVQELAVPSASSDTHLGFGCEPGQGSAGRVWGRLRGLASL